MNRNLCFLTQKFLQPKIYRNCHSSGIVWDKPEQDEQFMARLRKLVFGERGNKKLAEKEEHYDEEDEDD